MADDSEPCDEFLQSAFPDATSTLLRDHVLRQTLGVVRRRRYARRVLWAAALAACYVAGFGTLWLAGQRPAERLPIAEAATPDVIAAVPGPPEVLTPRVPDDVGVPALVLERRGERAAKPLRAAFFRRAGDSYIAENNLAAAVRCYRRALDLATPGELVIEPNDNWLLIALKDARNKEKSHDPDDG